MVECLGCLLLAGPPPTHWSGRAPCQMRLSDFSPESPCIQRFRTVAATVRQLPTIRQHPDGEWLTKSILKHYSDRRSTPRCRYIRRSECWPVASARMTVSAIRSMTTTHPPTGQEDLIARCGIRIYHLNLRAFKDPEPRSQCLSEGAV